MEYDTKSRAKRDFEGKGEKAREREAKGVEFI